MKKNIKIGILSSLILAPVAVTIAEQPVFAESAEQQKVFKDFAYLNMSTSMIDYDLYIKNLDAAFAEGSEIHTLLLQKLDYINSYNKQKKAADDLKTEISKLTLTNKTLFKDYEEAYRKYVLIRDEIYKINDALASALTNAETKAKGELESYEKISGGVLSNIKAYYEQPASEIVANLMGVNNQNLLAERNIQINNIKEKNYIDLVEAIYKANLNATSKDNYKTNIDEAKEAYSKFTTVEKTIADNQLINGTTVTNKQAMTEAENNIAKAAAFDQSVTSIPSDLSNLKTQLIAIDKAYNALTPMQKLLISDASSKIVEPFQEILDISGQIGALKANNTEQYRKAIDDIQGKITGFEPKTIGQVQITKDNVESIIPNVEKFTAAKKDIEAIAPVEAQISALKGTATPSLKVIQEARSAYNTLSSNLKKLVKNLSDLTDLESADKDAKAVDKKIDAIKVSNKVDFYKRYIEAQSAYDTLKNKDYAKSGARLLSLEPYAKLVNDFILLDSKAEGYTDQVTGLLNILKSDWIDTEIDSKDSLTPEDKQQLKIVRDILMDRSSATDKAKKLVENIDALTQDDPGLLRKIMLYRMTYNEELDATAKKLVTNIKKLTDYEKANKAAVSVMKLVDSLDPLSPKFVNSVVAARKAYNKLNSSLKSLIKDSEENLVDMEKISSVMLEIDNLKKSKDILADVEKARQAYTILLGNTKDEKLIELLEETYAPKLVLAENRNKAVVDTIKEISGLENVKDYTEIGGTIQIISSMYKSLSSNDKKLVTNYSAFKNIEKDYKVASKVIQLIGDLPKKESSDYTKKVEAALKAYLKLNSDQTKYVHNYDKDLKPFIGVASLIGEIEQLKPSMKDFATIVTGLRSDYDKLSEAEKAQIHNYQKLVAAEKALEGPSKVIELIQKARPGVENYLNALQAARDAYDALNSDQKKQVTNYKELENREKAVKPVLSLNDLILKIGMQTSAKNFISNYEKAWKELDKISLQDRAILTNEKLLTETYVPLFNVMDRIESIKSSSKTFVDDVKAARNAFNALTADQKKQILNENLLKEHEINVQGGAYVDELIRALKSNPPAEYVQKVHEAEEAYKNLSSANKKAVTLYDELKVELKYIAPVVQAIEAINLLETSGGKLDAQVKKVNSILAKLTDEQYALIPNMEKYNNLGNVIQVVSLIELIKPSDTKYYIGNTKAAEIAYNRLSPTEKQKVTNYSNLEDALLNVAALDQITKKISELSNVSSTYVDDVNHLLDEYKKLPSALKKQVSNYGKLQQAEKDVDAADKVIRAIVAIDPGVRTFESKVVSARKAYDKLTADQKTLVSNTRLLLQYERELGL